MGYSTPIGLYLRKSKVDDSKNEVKIQLKYSYKIFIFEVKQNFLKNLSVAVRLCSKYVAYVFSTIFFAPEQESRTYNKYLNT